MKLMIALLIAAFAQGSVAQCLGEAQIIAKVDNVTKTGLSRCVATITKYSIQMYNESMVCPLDLNEVIEQGIVVTFKDGHDCAFEAGQNISGVLVKNSAGEIVLE